MFIEEVRFSLTDSRGDEEEEGLDGAEPMMEVEDKMDCVRDGTFPEPEGHDYVI